MNISIINRIIFVRKNITFFLSYVTVGEAPAFSRPLKDIEVTIPGAVKLSVDVDLGKPEAEIKWFRDWKEIYPGVKYSMSLNKRRAELEIKEPQTSDSGKYRCLLKNGVGEAESEAKLLVNCE